MLFSIGEGLFFLPGPTGADPTDNLLNSTKALKSEILSLDLAQIPGEIPLLRALNSLRNDQLSEYYHSNMRNTIRKTDLTNRFITPS